MRKPSAETELEASLAPFVFILLQGMTSRMCVTDTFFKMDKVNSSLQENCFFFGVVPVMI